MINPIVIIVSAALFLSVMAIALINKPKKPVVTGTIIVILIGYVIFTLMIDNTLSALDKGDPNGFVCFLTMSEHLTYEGLSQSFNTFMYLDIALIIGALLSLFVEILLILRKDAASS